jgi:hypothetical protein
MELHVAVKNLVKYQGTDFILDTKFVNALVDFNAFELNPALRNITRIIIEEGYSKKLKDCGTWNLHAQSIPLEIVNLYAFNQGLTEYAIKSLAFGLGYIDKVELPQNANNQQPNPIQTKPQPEIQFNLGYKKLSKMEDEDVRIYKEAAEEYLDSIIEIKGDWEKELGAKITISSQYEIDSYNSYISLHFEINGKITIKFEYHIGFNFVIYNTNGKIIDKTLGLLRKEDYKGFSVVETDCISEAAFKNIGNIGKIIVYWESL